MKFLPHILEITFLAALFWIPCFGAPFASPLVGLTSNKSVCFSPDEGCDDRLARFIGLAQKTVDVAVYDINRPAIVSILESKSKTLKVRLVVDERQSKGSHSAVAQLVAAGVNVRFGHQKGIMHDKFCIVDGVGIETGSFNYTTHASEANQENQLYSIDPQIVARFNVRFEVMWTTAKPYFVK